jgi:cytochrome c oxidase subunit II
MLRSVIFDICALLTALVFAVMFAGIWRSRRSSDAAGHFHRSAAVELVWALIPCLMFVACVIPAARQIMASASAP